MGTLVLSGATSGSTTIAPTDAVTVTATFPNATGTIMVSGGMPAFSAYQSSSQSIPASTYTKVQLQSKEFDTNSNFDNTTNYRFTPTVAGYYQVNGAVNWVASVAAAECFVVIYKNGSSFKFGTDSNATGTYASIASALVYCNGSTDYIEFYCYQATGISKSLNATNTQTFFQAAMIRSA